MICRIYYSYGEAYTVKRHLAVENIVAFCRENSNFNEKSLLKIYFFNLMIFVDRESIWRNDPYNNRHLL